MSTFQDSIPPYKIKLFGKDVIVYSVEQDKQILKCFEERKFLKEQYVIDSLVIDDNIKLINTCLESNKVNQVLIQGLNEEIELYQHQESILLGKLVVEKDINSKLMTRLNEFNQKERKRKTRNLILFTATGVIITGLLTGLIVKSVL